MDDRRALLKLAERGCPLGIKSIVRHRLTMEEVADAVYQSYRNGSKNNGAVARIMGYSVVLNGKQGVLFHVLCQRGLDAWREDWKEVFNNPLLLVSAERARTYLDALPPDVVDDVMMRWQTATGGAPYRYEVLQNIREGCLPDRQCLIQCRFTRKELKDAIRVAYDAPMLNADEYIRFERACFSIYNRLHYTDGAFNPYIFLSEQQLKALVQFSTIPYEICTTTDIAKITNPDVQLCNDVFDR